MYLGNNDKDQKKNLYKVNTNAIFFLNVFHAWLAIPMEA